MGLVLLFVASCGISPPLTVPAITLDLTGVPEETLRGLDHETLEFTAYSPNRWGASHVEQLELGVLVANNHGAVIAGRDLGFEVVPTGATSTPWREYRVAMSIPPTTTPGPLVVCWSGQFRMEPKDIALARFGPDPSPEGKGDPLPESYVSRIAYHHPFVVRETAACRHITGYEGLFAGDAEVDQFGRATPTGWRFFVSSTLPPFDGAQDLVSARVASTATTPRDLTPVLTRAPDGESFDVDLGADGLRDDDQGILQLTVSDRLGLDPGYHAAFACDGQPGASTFVVGTSLAPGKRYWLHPPALEAICAEALHAQATGAE